MDGVGSEGEFDRWNPGIPQIFRVATTCCTPSEHAFARQFLCSGRHCLDEWTIDRFDGPNTPGDIRYRDTHTVADTVSDLGEHLRRLYPGGQPDIDLCTGVLGDAVGRLSGKLGDIGIDDSFIKEVSEAVEPGESALFLLARDAQMERIEEALADFEYEFEIIETNLSPEDETHLRETFAAEEIAG